MAHPSSEALDIERIFRRIFLSHTLICKVVETVEWESAVENLPQKPLDKVLCYDTTKQDETDEPSS